MTQPLFQIDPDIRKARTLDADFYTDPQFFELTKERIFARTWHLAGRLEDLKTLTPVEILPGFLDEPLLLVKSAGGLKCLSNVCTHRAKLLVDEPCDADLIRCNYHGRRFALDGKLLSMPEFAGVVDFPAASDDLPRVACGEIGGFVLSALRPACSLAAFAPEAAAILSEFGEKAMPLTARREYEVKAHWALYCENYLEGFHIPYVHRGLNEIVDYGTYNTELFSHSSLQTALTAAGDPAARYLFIFPNLMFNIYDWGISVNVVRPLAPDRTVVEFLTYVSDESLLAEGAGADLETVEMEDEAVVESVQKGVRSRFYRSGRYSPTREQGTHHFHRLIAEFMGSDQG